jgi:nitrogen regulatory protein PII
MLKLEALVKPLMLEELLKQLVMTGVHSVSYSEVNLAQQRLDGKMTAEEAEGVEYAPCIKIEVILDKAHLAAVEDAVAKKVANPLMGGAEVTVFRVKESLRVLGDRNGDPVVEDL